MNKIIIIGNLTRDPELSRYGQDNNELCNLSVAVNRIRSKNNEVDYFNVTVFGKIAKNCDIYLKKGSKVAVTGSMQFSNYTGQDGINRISSRIIAEDIEFLTPKSSIGEDRYSSSNLKASNSLEEIDDFDDNAPF